VGLFKIDNDEVWDEYVKTGKVKGLSIEGIFEHEFVENDQDFYDVELMNLLEEEASYLLSKIKAVIKNDNRYKKKKRIDMESYSDYPQAVRNNAKEGIELNEKIGNRCATNVGKIRAKQLAKGEPISVETIKRMYSYLSRAEGVYRDKQDDSEACGNISYKLWGGLSALSWSRNKLRELGLLEENQQPTITSTYPGQGPTSGSYVSEQTLQEPAITYDYLPMFETEEEALEVAKRINCEGTHIHNVNGKDYYMPCSTHTETQDRILKDE